MALHVHKAPCLLDEPAQSALDCAVRRQGLLLAYVTTVVLRARAERGPASGVAPSRNAVAILHCAFCASSVGDVCMAVQHVPVPSSPRTGHDGLLFWKHFTV